MSRVPMESLTGKRGYVSAARTQKARETRKRVIDAATQLFVEQGYATTTMCGLTPPLAASQALISLVQDSLS